MSLHSFNQTLTVAGNIVSVDLAVPSFTIEARSGDKFQAVVGPETYYSVVSNLDGLDRNRVPDPQGVPGESGIVFNLRKYAVTGRPVSVIGIYQQNEGAERFEARNVYLLHSDPGRYMFEETHWWPTQITQMADRILDHLFDAKRSYSIDDFSEFYRTNLNILGQATDETVQECAVLSRLLYDLSSAYLMTGAERYLMAARAAANYLREAFRSLSHDGRYCFWAYGRRRNMQGERGESLLFASQGPDDRGTIPLYEQIYALAGLTQFYRITLDWEVLEDIRRTINSLPGLLLGFAAGDGEGLRRQGRLLFAPGPGDDAARHHAGRHAGGREPVAKELELGRRPHPGLPRQPDPVAGAAAAGQCAPRVRAAARASATAILEETSSLICEKFPDPDSDFVIERFHADWTPDLSYRWQQNRAVVGHNLKIAWNLTRCAYYFQTRAKRLRDAGRSLGGRRLRPSAPIAAWRWQSVSPTGWARWASTKSAAASSTASSGSPAAACRRSSPGAPPRTSGSRSRASLLT